MASDVARCENCGSTLRMIAVEIVKHTEGKYLDGQFKYVRGLECDCTVDPDTMPDHWPVSDADDLEEADTDG